MKLECVVLVMGWLAAIATPAGAETYAVRVVRDVPYLQGANYADDKDKLDLYLPEGRRNAPVIVSYYGNQLMGGDKSEDAYIGRRFAAAGFVTAVVNYRLSPAVSHPAHVQDAAASFAWVKRHIARVRRRSPIASSSSATRRAATWRPCCRPIRVISRRTTCRRVTSAVSFRSARSTGSSAEASHPIATRACGVSIGASGWTRHRRIICRPARRRC